MTNRSLLLVFLLTLITHYTKSYQFQSTLGHIKTKTSTETQKTTVENLIKRLIPERANEFLVEINPNITTNSEDAFILKSVDGKIQITGTTGVVAANGFHYYLKYYCNSHVSWEANQLNLPKSLPEVDIKIVLNSRFRYYQNVCTTSYSFVWWNWAQWEKHIDWMALNSFNLVLSFNGQEAIWERVYQKLKLTQDDIDEHFTGPAFLSWLRMGNIRGWAGPLSSSWNERSLILQKQILQRMRDFGMTPVLPAFAGHLPRAFKRLYPDVNMVKIGTWNGFNDTYCCPYFLDPTEALFKTIGKLFIEEQIAEYGTDHVYNCDSFNEVDPLSTDLSYLANVSKSIYEAITETDPDGIWLMQGWLFVHDLFFWTNARAKALLTGAPLGKMIILDLQSEQFPQYNRLEQYFGQPYIWCMLHNFGGTLGNFGSVEILNKEPIIARNANGSTMIGIGLTPEGINQNYVVYDFMMENVWRNEPTNLTEWFKNYTLRRYGVENYDADVENAWQLFKSTVYNFTGLERMRGQYAITRTPSWKIDIWTWYDKSEFARGVWEFLEIMKDLECDTCRHDSIDFGRQLLQILGDVLYVIMLDEFNENNLENFETNAASFMKVFHLMDLLLQESDAFSLKRWIEDARNCANNTEEADFFEYNARNQITLWGPKGEIMNYANKQWAGVVSNFFSPRWELFINYTKTVLSEGGKFNQSFIKQEMFDKVEEPFTFMKNEFYLQSKGNLKEILDEILNFSKTILQLVFSRSERSFENNEIEDDLSNYLQKYGEFDKPTVILN